jgi:hypothetical protein
MSITEDSTTVTHRATETTIGESCAATVLTNHQLVLLELAVNQVYKENWKDTLMSLIYTGMMSGKESVRAKRFSGSARGRRQKGMQQYPVVNSFV